MFEVKVQRVVVEAAGIHSFELVDPHGHDLPPFAAGAHIDVMAPGPHLRQYSLCNDPRERTRYVIGVLREDSGRGGSKAMHSAVRAGDHLRISAPRNNFGLVEDAKRHLLIAGGIGITPMMAMVERLKAMGADFTLHYCARSPQRMAFKERLAELHGAGRAVYHYDEGDPAKGIRLADVVGAHAPGTHLYHCGPVGLMQAINEAAARWPAGSVHDESFAPPPSPAAAGAFTVRLASSGAIFNVPRGMSIVQVLRGAGIECETSCEAGLCGTCRTRYLDGTPEHHDFVLSEDEQREFVMICCARAASGTLVLDR